MSMVAPAIAMMLFAVLWGAVIVYALARWKQNRAGVDDPQFGLKFALHLFRLIGQHLLLFAGFLLLYSMLLKGNANERSPVWRAAFGFITAGGIVFGAHTLVLGSGTNQGMFPALGRLFAGLSMIITGLFATAALIGATQTLFAKGSSGDAGRAIWSALLVYGGAWVVQGALYLTSHGQQPPTMMAPPMMAPPGPPAPAVPEPMRQPLAAPPTE